MGVSKLEDLVAWQLAHEFKIEVYRLIEESPGATADFTFRTQLCEAACGGEVNIGEGFYRYGAADFARFLGYALSSIGEAELRVKDGIDRKYFNSARCEQALTLATRSRAATLALHQSLQPFIKRKRGQGGPRTKAPGPPRTPDTGPRT